MTRHGASDVMADSSSRRLFKNRKLRVKDMMEWRTSKFEPHEGETVAYLPLNEVSWTLRTP